MAMESTASMRGGEGEKGVSATTTIYIPISKPHQRSDLLVSDIFLLLYRPSAAVSAPVLPASSAASALRTAANAAAKRCLRKDIILNMEIP